MKTEPASPLRGPFGEIDLDPGGVEVDANKDETELFALRYCRFDTDDTKALGSAGSLFCVFLTEGSPEVVVVESSEGVTLLNGVMKVERIKDYPTLFSIIR